MKWKHEVERYDITDEDFTTVVGREPRSREEFMVWAMVVERRTNDYVDLEAVHEDALEALDDFKKEAKDRPEKASCSLGVLVQRFLRAALIDHNALPYRILH